MKKAYLIFLLFCMYLPSYGEKPGSGSDSLRLARMEDKAWGYIINKPDSAIYLSEQIADLSRKTNLKLFEGLAYNTMGVAYKNKGNYPKALEYDLKSLKIEEALHARADIGNCYINLGLVYYYQNDFPKSLGYLLKAQAIEESVGSTRNLANTYLDLGNVYYAKGDVFKSLDYYQKAQHVAEKGGDKQSVADSYIDLGNVYFAQNDFPNALAFYKKALVIKEQVRDKQGIAECYINIGSVYNSLKLYPLGVLYADSVKRVSTEIGDLNLKRYAYELYSDAYSASGKYKEAYNAHVRFKRITDSIFNTENSKQLSDLKTNFEVEKKELELKTKASTQMAIAAEEKKRQQFVTWAVAGLLLLVFIFAVFMFNRFRMTQRQKQIIEKQKDLVEEKQKEILDSITYARRLQQAILPSDAELLSHFPESFLLYKPKDIVAGDFYWMHAAGDTVFLAVADCTGHGVPGAMVSVVCSNALNRSVKEFGLNDTGQILGKTRELVLETFAKSNSEVMDGMDISLLAVHKGNGELTWSGANTPLWYVSGGKVEIVSPDKQPIGKTDIVKPFTTNRLHLNRGDVLFLMSDGYADQFGGPKGKKYKNKQLEEQLLAISDKTPQIQKEHLSSTFESWKGSLEQVDDVTIIGLKIRD